MKLKLWENELVQVLVVQEKYCSSSQAGLWKIPTGFILEVFSFSSKL